MKNIFYIVKRDMIKIATNRAALVVIVALTFLPSLYAWFNIKASWDPYANTAEVAVAISSLDEGATVNDKDINIGEEVIVNLTENNDLGWTFVSEDEAIKGVEHGDYYAAIVIPENFSEKLVSVTTKNIEKPELDYYINEKVNAISPKVTKSGASAIVENIHTSFLKEANEAVISVFNTVGLELEHHHVDIEKARDAIFRLEDEMPTIYAHLMQLDKNLNLADVAMDSAEESFEKVDQFYSRANELNNQLQRRLKSSEATVEDVVKSISDQLEKTKQTINKIPQLTDNISKKADDDLNKVIDALYSRQAKLDEAADRLNEIHHYLQNQNDKLQQSTKINDLRQSLNESEQNLRDLSNNLQQVVQNLKTGNHPAVSLIERTNEIVARLNSNLQTMIDTYESVIVPQMELVIEQADGLVETINETFDKVQQLNGQGLQFIEQLIEKENESLPMIQERLEQASMTIESNLARVNRVVFILNVMTHVSNNEQLVDLLTKFESLQQQLQFAQKITNEALQMIEQGNAPSTAILNELKQTLQIVDEKVGQIAAGFDERTEQTLQQAMTQLKQTNEHLMERFQQLEQVQSNLKTITTELEQKMNNPEKTIRTLEQVISKIDNGVNTIRSIQNGLNDIQQLIDSDFLSNEIDRILNIRDEILNMNQSIGHVIERIKEAKQTGKNHLQDVEQLAQNMNNSIEEIVQFVNGRLLNNYKIVVREATNALEDISDVLTAVDDKLPKIKKAFNKIDEGIAKGKEKVAIANEHFPEAKNAINDLASKIRELEKKGDLDQLIDVLMTDPVKVSEFLAEPILLNEHELYPIPNYGSAMNPFYTTLALWVGGLLLISSLKVDIDDKKEFKSYEVYGGRLLTFLSIGVLQSLIVTLGNIFFINAYIVNKFSYVIFGLLISMTFMTIIYTFVSVFGNTGKVLAIILLVMQLGGSGGTFPIQMAPPFFQKIYKFVPFTHSINLLRESIGGVIWNVAWKHIIYLIVYFILSLAIGIGLKKTINKSSDAFTEKARESDIVI